MKNTGNTGSAEIWIPAAKKLVKRLLRNDKLAAFFEPVDWEGAGLEDYP
jgi:hypothetical protein